MRLALVAAIVALAACGTGGRPLGVELTDHAITVDPASVAAGRFVLNIRNAGTQARELQIIRTDAAADALPYNTVAQQAKPADKVAERESIRSTATAHLTVDLPAGHYVLLCDIPGHYAAGMRVSLDVR